MKKLRLFKKQYGYTIVEIILVLAIIILTISTIYMTYTKQYSNYLVRQQADYLENLSQRLENHVITLGVNPTNAALTPDVVTQQYTDALSSTNLVAARIVNEQMLNQTSGKLENLFGGELFVNGINIGGIPMIQITLTNVPQESCGKMAANYVIASKSRVQINGIDVKLPGQSEINISDAVLACANPQNSISYVMQPMKLGNLTLGQVTNDTTGQIGAVRFSESSDNITPLSETVTSAPAGCGTGASWNATTSACECPVNTVWSGKECLPYGSPGVCPGGQGWDFVSRTCLTLTALPAVPNVYIPGTGIAGGHSPSAPDRYVDGKYVPNEVTLPTQKTITDPICYNTGNPVPGASPASNPNGNFNGKTCNYCVYGTWNGTRCEAPNITP